MEKKYYDILILYDDISKNINDFLNFVQIAVNRYYPEEVDEIRMFVSKQRRAVYILFRFDFKKFFPSYFVWFNNYCSKINLKIVDFMKFEQEKRELQLQDIIQHSDYKFVTPFEIDTIGNVIKSVFEIAEDKRASERIRAEIKVKFKTPRDFLKKYTEDISKGGLFVKAVNPLPHGTPVTVKLMLPGYDDIELKGKVVYVLKEDEAVKIGRSPGMGIEFLDLSEPIVRRMEDLVKKIKEKVSIEFDERRKDERVLAEIKLKFKSANGFIQKYAEDISKGGVFISTDKPLPFDTVVKLVLIFPDGEELKLDGKVIYVLNQEEAKKLLRSPGMGVQFINVTPEMSKKLEEKIEKLKLAKLNGEKKK